MLELVGSRGQHGFRGLAAVNNTLLHRPPVSPSRPGHMYTYRVGALAGVSDCKQRFSIHFPVRAPFRTNSIDHLRPVYVSAKITPAH